MAKTAAEKLKNDYVDREFTTIDRRTFKMGDFFNPEDFVISDKGSEGFISHDALLRVAKKLFRISRRDSLIDQGPNASNGNCAAVTVSYYVVPVDKDGIDIKIGNDDDAWSQDYSWSSSADCSKDNAPPGFERYPTTIAETRASGRCLRNILNVPYCTKEEYGETTLDVSNDKEPIRPGIITMIEKKFMGDYGIKMEQIKGLVKREFTELKDLTSAEGADLVQKLHRNLEKLKKEAKE